MTRGGLTAPGAAGGARIYTVSALKELTAPQGEPPQREEAPPAGERPGMFRWLQKAYDSYGIVETGEEERAVLLENIIYGLGRLANLWDAPVPAQLESISDDRDALIAAMENLLSQADRYLTVARQEQDETKRAGMLIPQTEYVKKRMEEDLAGIRWQTALMITFPEQRTGRGEQRWEEIWIYRDTSRQEEPSAGNGPGAGGSGQRGQQTIRLTEGNRLEYLDDLARIAEENPDTEGFFRRRDPLQPVLQTISTQKDLLSEALDLDFKNITQEERENLKETVRERIAQILTALRGYLETHDAKGSEARVTRRAAVVEIRKRLQAEAEGIGAALDHGLVILRIQRRPERDVSVLDLLDLRNVKLASFGENEIGSYTVSRTMRLTAPDPEGGRKVIAELPHTTQARFDAWIRVTGDPKTAVETILKLAEYKERFAAQVLFTGEEFAVYRSLLQMEEQAAKEEQVLLQLSRRTAFDEEEVRTAFATSQGEEEILQEGVQGAGPKRIGDQRTPLTGQAMTQALIFDQIYRGIEERMLADHVDHEAPDQLIPWFDRILAEGVTRETDRFRQILQAFLRSCPEAMRQDWDACTARFINQFYAVYLSRAFDVSHPFTGIESGILEQILGSLLIQNGQFYDRVRRILSRVNLR